jgi:hypothetical protein
VETVDEGRFNRRASGGTSQQREGNSNTLDSSSRQGREGIPLSCHTRDTMRDQFYQSEIMGVLHTSNGGLDCVVRRLGFGSVSPFYEVPASVSTTELKF